MSTLTLQRERLHQRMFVPVAEPGEPLPTALEIQGGGVDHRARIAIAVIAVASVIVSAVLVRS